MMKKEDIKKVVLAYSGGLDTSIIIPWLKENYNNPEIIAVSADVGQGDELDGLEEKAIKTGASKLYVEDLTDEMVDDVIIPSMMMGAKYEDYLLGTAFARPIIAKKLVEIAKAEGADAIVRSFRQKKHLVTKTSATIADGIAVKKPGDLTFALCQQYVDEIVAGIQDLWKLMNISNDRFIRTTDDYHVEAVQRIFKKMYDKGDIYKGKYSGMYCTPCESFWTESQLVDGKCPDCGREVHYAEEEAYFFRLSKYAEPVRELLLSGTFLEPASRVNEMIKNFIDPGLEDLCVSRTSFTWGIPVDFDPGHVVYVWVDALALIHI